MTKNPKDPTMKERFSAAEAALTAIHLIRKAYDEAYQASMEQEDEADSWQAEKDAKQAAAEALPVMCDRQTCSVFISCVVWMQARGWMTASDARGHLYAAQTYMATLIAQKAGSN